MFIEIPAKKEASITPGEFLEIQLIDSLYERYELHFNDTVIVPRQAGVGLYLFEVDTSSLDTHHNYEGIIWGFVEKEDSPGVENKWRVAEFHVSS